MHKTFAAYGLSVVLAATLLSSSARSGEFGGEVLSNQDIVRMTQANIAPATIIAKINSTPNSFDTSTTSIIALQSSDVPNEVITAMMTAPASLRAAPGLTPLDEARFRTELANIASGVEDAKYGALSWLQANREQTLPALRQALGDPRPEMRMAALIALGQMRDAEGLPAMRNLITDSSLQVRHATAKVLAELNDTQAIMAAETALSRPLRDLDGYARLVGYARLTRAAGVLGRVLSTSQEAATRAAAAWAIGEIGRPGIDGRPALEKALESDPDSEVRREAAQAIAKFHDARSARMLEDACRKDYEVRKVALAAMAEYPESVGFLVGVMGLGADQIAADELETARLSLVRLTSQDFGLDGVRWSQWYAENRSRYPSGDAAELSSVSGGSPFPSGFGLPAAPSRPQIDLEAWSIVADSHAIPMAPQVDIGGGVAMPGLPGAGFGPAPEASWRGADGFGPALPPSSTAGATPDLSGFGDGLDAAGGSIGPAGGGSLFRTWSAADDAPAGSSASSSPASASRTEGPAAASDVPEWDDPTAAYGDDEEGYFTSSPSTPTAMPTSPVVSPMPSSPAASPSPSSEPAASPLSGISLSLPGMEGGAASSSSDSGVSGASAFDSPASSAFPDSGSYGGAAGAEPSSSAMSSPYSGNVDTEGEGYYEGNFDDILGLDSSGSQDDLFAVPDTDTATDSFSAPAAGTGFETPAPSSSGSLRPPSSTTASDGFAPAEAPSSGLPGLDGFDGFDGFVTAEPTDSPAGGSTDALGGFDGIAPGYQPADAGTQPSAPPYDMMPSSSDESAATADPLFGDDMFSAPPASDSDASSAPATDFSLPPPTPDPSSEWEGQAQYDATYFDLPDGQSGGATTVSGQDAGDAFSAPPAEIVTSQPEAVPADVYVPTADTSTGIQFAEPTPQFSAPVGGDSFTDPSAPMPPVRPEGTITAPKGKDVPLLGEGMFGR